MVIACNGMQIFEKQENRNMKLANDKLYFTCLHYEACTLHKKLEGKYIFLI